MVMLGWASALGQANLGRHDGRVWDWNWIQGIEDNDGVEPGIHMMINR